MCDMCVGKNAEELVRRMIRSSRRVAVARTALSSFEATHLVVWKEKDLEKVAGWEFLGCGRNPGRGIIAAAWENDHTLCTLDAIGVVQEEGAVPIEFWSRLSQWDGWHHLIPVQYSKKMNLHPTTSSVSAVDSEQVTPKIEGGIP